MAKLIRDNAFKSGFVIGLLIFIGLNLYSAIPEQSARGGAKLCFDCYETYGFPFDVHEYGTIAHFDQFIWSSVVANIAIALVASSILGLLSKIVYEKIASQRQELK